ncbi:hypothetical protein [Aquibacillus albus]|uniref:Uncharacterized protein n=1 Tax=Aquibacillus albus TaxID=1168171 RepID=A0ABS2N6G0_9BACI|nr:hypothetical protein [Aquibacillus albus]MBM7573638.1 hypothetical protein [Aquibacillus albus]
MRVINDLPKGTERLMVRSANRLMYGYKKQKEKLGGVASLPKQGLDIYMRLARYDSPNIVRARDLAHDAKERKATLVVEL